MIQIRADYIVRSRFTLFEKCIKLYMIETADPGDSMAHWNYRVNISCLIPDDGAGYASRRACAVPSRTVV